MTVPHYESKDPLVQKYYSHIHPLANFHTYNQIFHMSVLDSNMMTIMFYLLLAVYILINLSTLLHCCRHFSPDKIHQQKAVPFLQKSQLYIPLKPVFRFLLYMLQYFSYLPHYFHLQQNREPIVLPAILL